MNNEGERIQKVLADAGVASRRKIEEMVVQGRITVNGHKAAIGMKIHPKRDVVAIDGVRVDLREKKRLWYLALNKPRGYVTTSEDEMGRRCVVELVEDIPERVYPVGRLDKNSEGLLFLTNDGAFANMIMHPSNHITKTYRVTVRPDISDEQAVRLSEGVVLDDGVKTAPANVVVLDKQPNRVVLQISIHEGRNRQIRRMCEAVGLTVARLKRTAVGPIKLGMLQPGEWRELSPSELIALRNAAGRTARPGASGISGMTSRPGKAQMEGRSKNGSYGAGASTGVERRGGDKRSPEGRRAPSRGGPSDGRRSAKGFQGGWEGKASDRRRESGEGRSGGYGGSSRQGAKRGAYQSPAAGSGYAKQQPSRYKDGQSSSDRGQTGSRSSYDRGRTNAYPKSSNSRSGGRSPHGGKGRDRGR